MKLFDLLFAKRGSASKQRYGRVRQPQRHCETISLWRQPHSQRKKHFRRADKMPRPAREDAYDRLAQWWRRVFYRHPFSLVKMNNQRNRDKPEWFGRTILLN